MSFEDLPLPKTAIFVFQNLGRTDGQMNGKTDGQTDGQPTGNVPIFKKENLKVSSIQPLCVQHPDTTISYSAYQFN